jgi:hypothetical protein
MLNKELESKIAAFEASLSDEERARFSDLGNGKMANTKTTKVSQQVPPVPPQEDELQAATSATSQPVAPNPSMPQPEAPVEAATSANSQMQAPPAPAPPAGVPEAPVQAATSANSQMNPAPAPMEPPGVEAATSATSQPVTPPAPPAMGDMDEVEAQDISNYVDEHKPEAQQQMSNDEMGIRPQARYASVYGHLRIRANSEGNLEVIDPQDTSKTALLTVRTNNATKRSKVALQGCAVRVLQGIAKDGLVVTARKWKALVKKADGGVVDYGDTNMVDAPSYDKSSITEDGASVLKNENYDANGVTSTTKEDGLTAKEKHPARNVPGLGGPLKTAQISGGSLSDRETNLADENNDRSEKSLSSTEGRESNMAEDYTPFKMSDTSLEDAENVLADPEYQNKAAASFIEEKNDKPESGLSEEDEAKIAAYYDKKAQKLAAEKVKEFSARLARCIRMAARRQALNLESNQIKIALADVLMSPAFMSRHEEYVPMDERTATFVIERALDQKAAVSYIDSLFERAASLMKMSDESLAQLEADLKRSLPVNVTAQFGTDDGFPEEEEVEVEEETPEAKAASRRRSADEGNFDISPAFGKTSEEEDLNPKRRQISAALNGTRAASRHSAFFPQGR